MTPNTLLLRQIHPSFIQNGRVTSQAFRPTPKDEFLLSVDNGDLICAQASYQRFNANPACKSVGVQAVSQQECAALELPIIEDGQPYPEHCSLDFRTLDRNAVEKKAKLLRTQAQNRGWLFQA